jgi:hypothetical protein
MMAIKKEHWKPIFETFPCWICPKCQEGTLVLDNNTLRCLEPKWSAAAGSEQAWEPDWICETFSALLVCQNGNCGEVVAIGGRTEHDDSGDYENRWHRYFKPIYLFPSPPIFRVPDECPEVVKSALEKAFALFWSDLESCLNRLRTSAEALLTERRIPRTVTSAKHRKIPLYLHARIERFGKKNKDAAELLLAIKWLGNNGSHDNTHAVGHEEVLDAFELFELVLNKVYSRSTDVLVSKAKKITRRKGKPIKPRKAKSGLF